MRQQILRQIAEKNLDPTDVHVAGKDGTLVVKKSPPTQSVQVEPMKEVVTSSQEVKQEVVEEKLAKSPPPEVASEDKPVILDQDKTVPAIQKKSVFSKKKVVTPE